MIPIIVAFLFFSLLSCSSKENSTQPPPQQEQPQWVIPAVRNVANVEQVVLYSASAKSDVSFHIFVPDEYHADTVRRFPVIYWLQGGGGGEQGISPLTNIYRQAIAEGSLEPVIIVFPHGLPLGMWCNSKDGRQPVEDVFIKDMLPYIDANYRTRAERNGRVVEGFSMGGYGAGRFGFKYSHLFGGFSMFGAGPLQLDFSEVAPGNRDIQPIIFRDVYGEDMDYFEEQSPWRLAERYGRDLPTPTPKRIIIGNEDFTLPANRDFHEHLKQLEIPHQYREFNGIGHLMPPLLTALGQNNWTFYSSVFGR